MTNTNAKWNLLIDRKDEEPAYAFIYNDDHRLIASSTLQYNGHFTVEEKIANWQKMAAAPELLEVLKGLIETVPHADAGWWEKAHEIIARVEARNA